MSDSEARGMYTHALLGELHKDIDKIVARYAKLVPDDPICRQNFADRLIEFHIWAPDDPAAYGTDDAPNLYGDEAYAAYARDKAGDFELDSMRIDFLQKLTDEKNHTGRVILRESARGNGWRLHESDLDGSVPNVRDAIDTFMREFTE